MEIIENSKDILLRKKQKAIALRYHPEFDSAPKILAGGDGEIANRIVELRDGELILYQGNYAYYLQKKEEDGIIQSCGVIHSC